jgi:hypothetical protein
VAVRQGTVWVLLFLCAVVAPAAQRDTPVGGDNSDWWSNVTDVGTDLSAPQTNLQHRELGPSTLEIGNIKVGLGEIDKAAARFGKARVMSRGDASSSRIQACYVSEDSQTHLIFQEDGEGFGAEFYLFKDGPRWNSSDLCAKSPLVSGDIATASGLHLGMTPAEVEALLGNPSVASAEYLRYDLQVRKRTTADDLAKMRAQHPKMSGKELNDSYGFYYVTSTVVAKFKDSKLTYLDVGRYESYP